MHIIKRNQPVCVVPVEDEYEKLTRDARAHTSVHSHSVLEWFALPASGVATKVEIDQRLNAERDLWDSKSINKAFRVIARLAGKQVKK